MKAKVIMEFEEDFVNFIMEEGNIQSKDELRGFLRGLYSNIIQDEKGVKDIRVEVYDETDTKEN